MRYRVDSMNLRDGVLVIEGWCIPARSDHIEYSVVRRDGTLMKSTAVARDRVDVAAQFSAPRMSGFTVAVPFERDDDAYLVMRDLDQKRRVHVNSRIVEKSHSVRARRLEKLIALVHFETLVVSWDFVRENGLRAFIKKAVHKIEKIDEDFDYAEWELKTRLPESETESQKNSWQQLSFPSGKPPVLSLVIPCYNTDEANLRMLLCSISNQTYPVFEVIIADGSDENHETVRAVVASYTESDERVKYFNLSGNHGISGNTNLGIEKATGDFIALIDHDDELPEYALYEVALAISENPGAMFIYTDEDKIDFDGRALFEPNFKPDLDMDLLTSVNYICHLTVIRRDLLSRVGGLKKEFDGAQDHDFFFRLIEEAVREERSWLREAFEKGPEILEGRLLPSSIEKLRAGMFTSEKVIHIPKICYHWRCHKGSTALDPKSKLYAFEAGARAVGDHYEREGIFHSAIEKGVTFGYYHTVFGLSDVARGREDPLISVIIPTKDHTEDLERAVRSILERAEYRKLEFLIIENNSEDEETFRFYDEIDNVYGADRFRLREEIPVRVIRFEGGFNYSAINNFGAAKADGEILFFLNNDTELKDAGSLTEMAALSMRPETGAVGARLVYGDDTIQHAGVVVGLGGIAGAAFTGLHEKENSYMHRMMCLSDLSAVTAAAMMMRRDVFERVGGFNEELAVAFNDIDLCMKVRALGMNVIYDPYAVFYHYESKTRGLEDTPEKVTRFNNEIALFASRWGEILEKGDPFYNPNLTLRKSNFALRDLTKEKPGEPMRLELNVEEQLKIVLEEKKRRGI